MVAEILKRNGESVSGAKLAPSSPGVKTVGLLQAGHEPCARRVGAKAKAANRAMVKYCTEHIIAQAVVKVEYFGEKANGSGILSLRSDKVLG